MNRRDFVARFGTTMAAAGAATAGVASVAYDKTRTAVVDGSEQLAKDVKAMAERLDKMEASQKRLLRVLITVVSLSTGLDVLNLLKGDPWG